jgi:hypothetical protein
MVTTLSDRVRRRTIRLLNDVRQTIQILAVDHNLNAIGTFQGRGDSFRSICLGLPEKEKTRVAFVVVAEESPC